MHIKLRKKHLFEIGSLVAVLTLNVGLYSILHQKATEVNAYNSASLPTTINLNDCSESEIRSYYSGLNSLSTSERKGTNLLKNLKTILSNGQQYFSYDSGSAIWQIYEIADRDWVKSPASSTQYGTYNSSTNTITNYSYGTSSSNSKNNPYIHALYINRNLDNQTRAWDSHQNNTAWGMNREHIWAKSHGFQDGTQAGARGDPMHLWASNAHSNGIHSNNFYAFVDKSKTYTDCGDKYNNAYNNYSGKSKNAGGGETVFEPQDCDKGDIARAIFYMAARYNNFAGAASGFDGSNPNLVLANDLSENSRTGTSTATNPYAMGLLSDLLAWNKLDPVDEYEIHRNNLLYRNYTKNRNPFIDFPSWADAIWGTADLDGKNYDSTINSVANPSTDAINSGSSVAVFGVSNNSINLQTGNTAEVYGMNAEGNISWTNSDNTVISLNKNNTVNNEIVTVTALKAGTATITATNGSNSETCTVTVTDGSSTNYGTLEHPLTITEAKSIIDANGGDLTPEKMYVEGIVSSNSAMNTTYKNYEVWLQSENGQQANAFELYHAYFTDESLNDTYSAENSMNGCRVVAHGYGKKYNSTYELSPQNNNTEKPEILSITPTGPIEQTTKEKIEAIDTNSILSYRYNKQTTDGGVTDTFDRETTGRTGTGYGDWTHTSTDSGISYAGNSAAGNDAIQLRSDKNTSGIVVTANGDEETVGKITVTWNTNTTNGRKINIYGKNTAYSDPTDLYNSETQGTLLGTIVYGTSVSLTITGSYNYFGLRSNSGALWLDEIEIEWGGVSTTTYSYSDVSIRFGAVIEKDLWDELDTEDSIEGFGVMITTDDVVDNDTTIKEFWDSASPAEDDPDITEEIVDYYMPNTGDPSMPVPPEDEDDYVWNLFYRVTDFTKVYVAAAYIKTATDMVFFKEVRYSVKTLADDYIKNRGYDASVAGGSLANLAK